MTKKELIDKLERLPDEAKLEFCCDLSARDLVFWRITMPHEGLIVIELD